MTTDEESPRAPVGLLAPIAMALAATVVQFPIYDRWFGLLDEGYMLSLGR